MVDDQPEPRRKMKGVLDERNFTDIKHSVEKIDYNCTY